MNAIELSVNERIRVFLKSNNMSITKLSSIIDMPQTTINKQLTTDGNVQFSTIYAILAHFKHLSAEWLLRGNGDMMIAEQDGNVSIECSGDHINGNGNATRGGVVNTPCNDELIRLRTEVEYLKQQVSELKEDKKTLIELLKK